MCNDKFEDIFIKSKIPFGKCELLPEPFNRHAANYKEWEKYARKQTPYGKGLIVCACIKAFLTKDASCLETALSLIEFADNEKQASAIGLAGSVFCDIGQKAKGIQMLREALRLYSSPLTILGLATDLGEEEDISESIELCKSVLEDEPNNIRALRVLAVNYLMLENAEEARVHILHAINIAPKNKLLRQVMGDVFYDEENYSSALKEYKKAKPFLQFKPYITYKLACCYFYLGKLKKSKKRALKIDDDVFELEPYFRENSIKIKKMLSEIISSN